MGENVQSGHPVEEYKIRAHSVLHFITLKMYERKWRQILFVKKAPIFSAFLRIQRRQLHKQNNSEKQKQKETDLFEYRQLHGHLM
jgi:hypothetical protein